MSFGEEEGRTLCGYRAG